MVKPSGKWYRALYPMLSCLITSADDRKQNVFTVNWVMPCSFTPPLVVLSVGKTRFSHSLISKTREFVVCVPPRELEKQAWLCGTTRGEKIDKFKESELTPIPAKKVNAPLIKECLACLECRVVGEADAGDHTLFIAEVLEVHEQGRGKKLFYEGNRKFVD